MRQDNSTLAQKARLRRALLRDHEGAPVILETHGGRGAIYQECYRGALAGVVFEKDPTKAAVLARQRPTWAVYEADCVAALLRGAGAHLLVSVLDVDPYGDPWPTIDAFFRSERPRAEVLHVAVNDGLRNNLRMGGAWATSTLAHVVRRRGNNLFPVYLEVCQELMKESALQAGYRLERWAGYYCGTKQDMTHYRAVLTRPNLAD